MRGMVRRGDSVRRGSYFYEVLLSVLYGCGGKRSGGGAEGWRDSGVEQKRGVLINSCLLHHTGTRTKHNGPDKGSYRINRKFKQENA